MAKPTCLLLLLIFTFYVSSSYAATLYVAVSGSGTTCSDIAPCPSLQAAINVAASGDTISVGPGTFTGSGNMNLAFPADITLNIVGNGQGVTVIDLQQQGRFSRFEDSQTISISFLSIVNGLAPSEGSNYIGGCFRVGGNSTTLNMQNVDLILCGCAGPGLSVNSYAGAIYIIDATMELQNIFISGSYAPVAGSIYFDGSSKSNINNMTILGSWCNVPGGWGGAMVPEGYSETLITNSYFAHCYCPQGFGGVIDDGTDAQYTIVNSSFVNNTAAYGGAVYTYASAVSHWNQTSFIQNSADDNSGAIYVSSKTVVIIDGCLFDSNTAASNTVASYSACDSAYCVTVLNSLFINNRVTTVGAGVILGGNTYIANTVFQHNVALSSAAALYIYTGAPCFLQNLTFIENYAVDGGAIYAEGPGYYEIDGATFIANSAQNYFVDAPEATGGGGAVSVHGSVILNFTGQTNFYYNRAATGGALGMFGVGLINFQFPPVFEYNHAVSGGAIYSTGTLVLPPNSKLSGNTATSYGGGIFLDGIATTTAHSIIVHNNTAQYGAGVSTGISLSACNDFATSSFTNNTGISAGGALYIQRTNLPCSMCVSCSYSGNTAPFGANEGGIPVLINSQGVLPTSVTNSQSFKARFSVTDQFGQPALSSDRVMTVSIVNVSLPPGTDGSVQLLGPSLVYFVNSIADFGLLRISAPAESTVTLLFDTSPVVSSPLYQTVSILPCASNEVSHEEDGDYYCLTHVGTSLSTQIVITVIASLLLLLSIATLVWLFINRKKSAIKSASVTFCYITTIGAMFLFVDAIMWVYATDATCALRVWFIIVGFLLCYGALFVKEYRLWLILRRSNVLKPVRVTDVLLLGYISVGLFIELLITMIWFIVTPFLKRELIDLNTSKVTYTCTSTVTDAFFWLLLALNMVLLLLACVLSWFARNVPSNFNEAKQILFSIYNVTLTIIIVVILAQVFRTTPEATSLVVSIGIMFSTLVTLGSLFIPKFQLVANLSSVIKTVLKNIQNLEQDISWQRHLLRDLYSAQESLNSSSPTSSTMPETNHQTSDE